MFNAKRILKTYSGADTVGTKKNGNVILRWGYYYTNGKTSEQYAEWMGAMLKEKGVRGVVVNHGQVYKNFRGGASVASSSHFWVEIKMVA